MKNLTILLLSVIPFFLSAGQFNIGSVEEYKTPNAFYQAVEAGAIVLSPGDTINIDGDVYRGNDALAVWRTDNLLIRGIFERVQLYADGAYILGKGIFVSAGNDITYENIAFYDAAVPDLNGAGIRLDGSGLTVRHCLFFNNENGILANNSENGEVLIENSEFAVGGAGDGFSHNIYINHCALLTIQFCYFHEASVGHQIKSRATDNVIQYNRIADLDGNSSRLIDIPNGGQCLIIGNEIVQGPNAENNNVIGYGLEGLSNPGEHRLEIVNNTILNYRIGSCVYFHTNPDTDIFLVANNIMGGVCNMFIDKEPTLTANYVSESIAAINFVDEVNFNFMPKIFSLAVDNAEDLGREDLIPTAEYVHPVSGLEKEVIGGLDIGAIEADIIIDVNDIYDEKLTHPNPVENLLYLSKELTGSYNIYGVDGQLKQNGQVYNSHIEVSGLEKGIYILRFKNKKPIKFLKI